MNKEKKEKERFNHNHADITPSGNVICT